jgi:hypothetical protein
VVVGEWWRWWAGGGGRAIGGVAVAGGLGVGACMSEMVGVGQAWATALV